MPDGIEKDGDFTEIVDARIGRVDLVGAAANGHSFLIAKGAAGMIPADMVRDLVKKAAAAESESETTVADDVQTDDVQKADVTVDDLVAETPPGSTADSVPGSPDWETKDGDTAENTIGVLGRVKEVLTWLAGREAQEGVAGADDGFDNSWNLEDAACAIDYAITTLAPYAAGEELDVAMSEEAEGVIKATAGLDPAVLGRVESQAAIVKSGRVLSTANETALRDAVASIQKVLSSLPAAPDGDDGNVQKTVEETGTHVDDIATTDVVKADAPDGDGETASLTLVYDAQGNILGAIDPDQLTTFAPTPSGSSTATDDAPDSGTSNDEDAAPAGDEPTAADLTPVPAATAGTGASAPASVQKEASAPDVDLSTDELLKAAEDDENPRVRALVEIVKARQERIEQLEAMPAVPKAIANGAPRPVLKGQTSDGHVADDSEVAELRKQTHSPIVSERTAAVDALNRIAAEQFRAIRANGGIPLGSQR